MVAVAVEETVEDSEEDVEVVEVSEETEEVTEAEEDPASVTKTKPERKALSQDSKEPENNYDFSFLIRLF